jgi:hypothetical protein
MRRTACNSFFGIAKVEVPQSRQILNLGNTKTGVSSFVRIKSNAPLHVPVLPVALVVYGSNWNSANGLEV